MGMTMVASGTAMVAALSLTGCAERSLPAAGTAPSPTASQASRPPTASASPPAAPTSAAPTSAAPTSAAPTSAAGAADNGQVYSKTAATALANRQLDRIQLPPGAVLQHSPLPTALTQIGEGDGESLNVLIDRWYTVPGTATALATWVKAHPPVGYRGGDTSSSSSEQLYDFDPQPSTKAPSGMLSEGINTVGSSAGLRVHVQVDWLPTRTPYENIPSTVTSAEVHWKGPDNHSSTASVGPTTLDRTLTGAQLASVVNVLNSLGTTSPSVHSCPAPSGELVTLTFGYGGHHEVFTDGFSGCGGIRVTVDGAEQPQLADTEAWPIALHRALGITPAMDPAVSSGK